ncbi:MAG: TolC family protein [Pirellulales bacterium]|nr:TolC family protein [Pirellulales bacterium]
MIGILLSALALASGCLSQKPPSPLDSNLDGYRWVATQIEYPSGEPPASDDLIGMEAPRSISDSSQVEYWDLTLQEAIRLALYHSRVMLDLGGTVLRVPESVPTSFGPAVQETDPQYGVQAALSAFDASLSSSLFFENTDRRVNNRFVGNLGYFQQDFDINQTQITKRSATGSQFTVRQYVDFDKNNNLGNEFPGGVWNVYYEGEVRHPLLQGGGLEFNRIAGPGAQPGVFNGVLIARIRTDVSLADFQAGLRDLVSNVENAYWDLYFAYRNLDTRIKARDTALDTWRRVNALYRAGRRGGEAEKEAQAREQYFRFEEDVQNALAGRPLEGTRTNNGSSPGTFRGIPGVYINERNLRLLLGLKANDTRLIRPADEPPVSPVAFEWNTIAREALVQREELRRQRWVIKARELEWHAAKNYLLPNLDVVGRYRFRGFGEDLLDPSGEGKQRFDNAYMDLTSGDFQEWQAGLEFSVPIGYRQGHAGVRNAELRLTQARSVLREQERQVIHNLSNAISDLDRSYAVLQTDINRLMAAGHQLAALQAAYEADKADFYVVLDAQRRYAEAEDRYYQSRVEYALALRNVYFEKGNLLDYCGVELAEGPWPEKADRDAAEREHSRLAPAPVDYRFRPPVIVSDGPRGSAGTRGLPVDTVPPPTPQVKPNHR